MKASTKVFIVGAAIAIILAGAALSISYANIVEFDASLSVGEAKILMGGLELVDATFNSPNVYIHVDSFSELIEKAEDVDASIVFRDFYSYTVVDSDFSYAWQYNHTSSYDIMVAFLLLTAAFITILFTVVFIKMCLR